MAVKKTATKAAAKKTAPKTATKAAAKSVKKAAPKKAAAKATKKAAAEPEEDVENVGFNIEVDANPAMGEIVVEALRSEYFELAADDMEGFFEKEEVSDVDVQSLLCKVFIRGAIAGAAIAADEAQKGFEDVNKLLEKLTKK